MIIINLTHPLTADQRAAIEVRTGQTIARIVSQMFQFDAARELSPQVQSLLNGLEMSSEEWQTEPILVNLPGHAAAGACVVADLHGRMGHFPAILRLRPVPDSPTTRFEVAEIINLQALRERARQQRTH